jgi:lipocalin
MRILSALSAVFLAGCAPKVDNSVVGSFELERYLGDWHEIARFDHWFERGIEEATATYALREDGRVAVLNRGVKDGRPKTAEGVGRTTDTPGLLRVSFFGPFYSDYRVMALDEDYATALVGSGGPDYLWILSRTPRLDPTRRDALLSEAARRGYDTSKLLWIRQKE